MKLQKKPSLPTVPEMEEEEEEEEEDEEKEEKEEKEEAARAEKAAEREIKEIKDIKKKTMDNSPIYTHRADTLLKDLPPKKYEHIHVCTYKINTQELYPFIMFLLNKDDANSLNFTDLTGYTGSDLINYVLREFQTIFADVQPVEINYKGFIEDGNGVVLVLEYKERASAVVANKPIIEKGTYKNKWWWVLAAEIINNKQVLNFPINNKTTNFLIKNNKLCLIYDPNGKPYESPEIGYYGNYYKKIAAVASLGLSRQTPYSSFGPFYYFSNYTHAMRNAFWHIMMKPLKIGEEYITVDDKGRYTKGGLVRFALFTGKTKVLLGRPTDMNDDSQISLELAAKSAFVKAMLKLRDTGGKWILDYNSIRIGQHHIQFKDTDTDSKKDSKKDITTNPMIALRNYEQQVPLEYYFVDTTQDIAEENIGKALII